MIVVIPAYEPDTRLLELIDQLKNQTDYQILVVNDGSSPKCLEIFDNISSDVVLLKHDINRGKGRAMKTAFSYIYDHFPHSEGIVIADADGQHLLQDIVKVSEAWAAHPDHLVLGVRSFQGKVPFRSRFGNKLTQGVFSLASGVKVSDTQTGLRAFGVSYVPELLKLKGERYEFEMNMLLHMAKENVPIDQIPIETVYLNDNESSHFSVFRDSIKIYAAIFKFIASSLIAFGIDFVLVMLFSYWTRGMADEISLLISVVGARIISSLCNFFINKKVVFQDKGSFGSAFFKYYGVVVIVLACNYALMWLFHDLLGWNLAWTKILVEALLFVFSYMMQRFFVFKKKHVR